MYGISETKWKGEGTRDIGDYIVYYSGVKESEAAYGGVGIAINKKLCQRAPEWKAVNERLVWLRFNSANVPTTFVAYYVPTDETDDKDAFCDSLEKIIDGVHERDYLVESR